MSCSSSTMSTRCFGIDWSTVAAARFASVSKVLNVGYSGSRGAILRPGHDLLDMKNRVASFVRSRLVAAGALVALCTAGQASVHAQFVSQPSSPRNVLEGNWQSCQIPYGGPYDEQVYDHVVNGEGQYEVHLGPRREFAIFLGVQDQHRDHTSVDNLLQPFRVPADGVRGHHRWEIPTLNLAFTVTLGGGGRTDCESWYILLEPLKPESH